MVCVGLGLSSPSKTKSRDLLDQFFSDRPARDDLHSRTAINPWTPGWAARVVAAFVLRVGSALRVGRGEPTALLVELPATLLAAVLEAPFELVRRVRVGLWARRVVCGGPWWSKLGQSGRPPPWASASPRPRCTPKLV